MANPNRPTDLHKEDHPLWDAFVMWCRQNRVSMNDPDDWTEWWLCYLAGARALTRRVDR